MTWSEQMLWARIRARQLGVEFRRQVPIAGRFIVDFLAHEGRVVIEVDGGYHGRRQRADARRDEVLGRLGYRVLRFKAEEVMADLEGAVERIRLEMDRVE
jgi:crossover junction endodeoxyribonuclease RuvC